MHPGAQPLLPSTTFSRGQKGLGSRLCSAPLKCVVYILRANLSSRPQPSRQGGKTRGDRTALGTADTPCHQRAGGSLVPRPFLLGGGGGEKQTLGRRLGAENERECAFSQTSVVYSLANHTLEEFGLREYEVCITQFPLLATAIGT